MSPMNVLNDEKHSSSVQKSIWHCIQMLAPYQSVIIKDNNNFSEDDFSEGQEEFYRFIKTLYLNMYEEPEKYYIPTTPYDEYMETAKLKKGIEKAHYTDSKECNLRNTFQQAIQFYIKFFYEIGLRASNIQKNDYAIIISKKHMMEVKDVLKAAHLREGNEHRYDVIKSLGVEMQQFGDEYHITSRNYPKMFLGLWVLCYAPESKYKYMNYLRLDYKGYLRAMPDIDDIKAVLNEEHTQVINSIQNLLEGMKLKFKVKPLRSITSGFRWKAEYSYNGKSVFGFYAEPDYMMICIYFNSADNISAMSQQLAKMDNKLFEWYSSKFPERLCKCPSNRWANFGGIRRRICGLSCRAEVENPNSVDLENSIKVLRIFRNL